MMRSILVSKGSGMGKGAVALALLLSTTCAQARTDVLGQVDYELTAYSEDATYGLDAGLKNSVALRGEVYQDWDGGYQSITFKPFFRWDESDEERTHGDIREFIWHKVGLGYELKAGIGKVFWGVTESAHLVDIINQTDLVESIDGEQKLGQPMIQLLLERDWGNLDLFVLPYQRERTLPGQDGRLSGGLAYDDAQYENDQEQSHVAIAGRYYTYIDQLEYAVSAFHGTSREPVLGVSQLSGNVVPYYPLISQLGLEVQYLNEGWAWKLESIYREGMPEYSIEVPGQRLAVLDTLSGLQVAEDEAYWSSVAGFEYTQVGIFDSRIDLGWVAEHLYDSRQDEASLSAFEHDVLLATRWSFNDAEESTLLAGVLYDYEYQDYGVSLEASTRINNRLSIDVEARVFAPSRENPQFALRDDDFIECTLQYYF